MHLDSHIVRYFLYGNITEHILQPAIETSNHWKLVEN